MVTEIFLAVPVEPVETGQKILLTTGELVHTPYIFHTKRHLDGRYVSSEDDLFHLPLKPGDHYITEVHDVAIRFNITEEQLTDQRGPSYFYYEHLAKLGLVSISLGMKLEPKPL